jgi:hypothetical protein
MKTLKLLLPAVALFLVANCSAAKIETTSAENSIANDAPQTAIASAAADAAVSASEAAGQTSAPDAVIKELYSVHAKDNGKILNGKSRVLLDKYFDKNLSNLIWKDLTTRGNEVGVLDFDIFYNAQDMEIKKLTVAAPKIQNDKADVAVTFENFGSKETIRYALVKQNAAWKISDIKYKDGSLLQYFKDAANGNVSSADTVNDNFAGVYQVGDTNCTVKPVKMAFEVKWAKGTGTEMFFYEDRANDQYIYTSEDKGRGVNIFALNEKYDAGEFVRADGKRFAVKRIK